MSLERGQLDRDARWAAVQRELVLRAIEGDYDAFMQLVNESVAHQYAIATLILRDGDRAQDAVLALDGNTVCPGVPSSAP